MRKSKHVGYFLLFILSALLFYNRSLPAEPMRVTENLRNERVLLPPSAPDKDQLAVVSILTIVSGAEILAAVTMYDDPQTERPVDYMELYDRSGSLLSVNWIDRFGIPRTAMDRGLLREEASELEGILVLIPQGTPS